MRVVHGSDPVRVVTKRDWPQTVSCIKLWPDLERDPISNRKPLWRYSDWNASPIKLMIHRLKIDMMSKQTTLETAVLVRLQICCGALAFSLS